MPSCLGMRYFIGDTIPSAVPQLLCAAGSPGICHKAADCPVNAYCDEVTGECQDKSVYKIGLERQGSHWQWEGVLPDQFVFVMAFISFFLQIQHWIRMVANFHRLYQSICVRTSPAIF